jgi:hypothetical protein
MKLTFAIAIGGEPDPLDRSQRFANGFELGDFVAAFSRASAVKAIGAQKYRRPALPGWHDILWFEQVEQMSLGRENVPVARANSGANVFCLAGFLGDDNMIRQDGLVLKNENPHDLRQ